MAIPTIPYGSALWVLKTKQESRLQAAEMRYFSTVEGCTGQDLFENTDK